MNKVEAGRINSPFTRKEFESAVVFPNEFSKESKYPEWIKDLAAAGVIEMKVLEIVVQGKASVIQKFRILNIMRKDVNGGDDSIKVTIGGKESSYPYRALVEDTNSDYLYDETKDQLYYALLNMNCHFKGE